MAFVSVTFTGSAGTALSTHDANWTKHTSYGTGSVILSDANRARRNTNNTSMYWYNSAPAGADYTVTAPLFAKETDGGASNTGVCGRVDSAANTMYMARYGGGTTDAWQLFKIVGGTPTQLGSGASQSLTDETAYDCLLRMEGDSIELYKEGSGTPTISVTDTAITAAGYAGMRFVGTSESDTAGLHIGGPFVAEDIGGATHTTTGALSAQAATVAGTATHLTLHATSGALSAQAATVAGAALHPHLSTGALTAQAATVAGAAEVVAGGTHAASGALASDAATVAGSATHLTLHTTTGALSAQAATVAGSAAHLTLHTSTGALAAGEATMAGAAVHSGDGAVVESAPTGGGGWAWAAPRKKRHDYLSPPTREQMAERVRQQRIALGILPKPAQKRIEAAVKKEARRAEPSLAPLAPVAVEVAQDTGAPLRAVIEAIQRTFDTQRGLVAARMEADAAQRREEEAAAAERMRIEAEAAERAWRQRLPQLLAADDELLKQGEEARQQAIKTIRQVQQALMALLDR